MTFNRLARRFGAESSRRASPCLRLECLEDRSVPATFNVTTTLDVIDAADGKRSLREAITAANTLAGADVIVVPAGVYKIALAGPGENANATGDFDVTGAVTIQGAGAGKTIIDGQQLDRVFDAFGTAPSSLKVVFHALTIRNGNASGHGGGILFGNADLVVRDSAVTGNRASGSGGGVSNRNDVIGATGEVRVVRTTVSRNVAGGGGGGVSVTMINEVGKLIVNDSTVRRNLAGTSGGGILAAEATLTNCTVSGNTAGSEGGGILATTATLTGCIVSGNRFNGVGGGIHITVTNLTNSTISGNSAGGSGGGIHAQTATLTNCTVSGNVAADSGGGIRAGTATLHNVTIVENIAQTGGGLFHEPGGILEVRNSIVALNLVGFGGSAPDVSGTFFGIGPRHNLIGDGTGSTGFTDGVNGDIVGTAANPIDPKLGPLANNGGRTKTHALLAGSRAIDAGDNAGVPPTDQRGLPRKKDGNGDGVARVDIGAFER